MFEFILPWVWLALPLPWLVRRFSSAQEVEQQSGLFIPFADDFRLQQPSSATPSTNPLYLLLLAWCAWLCLLAAAAQPQWLGEPVELTRSGRDVMLAVDLSGSMQTKDFNLNGQQVDRLTATKAVASQFIQRREGDRIGLILFGSQAYLQTPLTFDRTTVNVFLQESAIGLAGKETAIGDAIGLAVKRLKDTVNSSDLVLILLTDGVNTAGELKPEDGIALAKKIGLRIHTIGIGASAMQVSSLFGSRTVNPSADLDEAMLSAIAEHTGGTYFRAHNTNELESIYALIDQLEPVERDSQTFRPISALFMYPLGAAMGILLLLLWLRTRVN
ncbi:MAG: VWA domain-containing protein [Ghiorsea sp.]